MATIVERGISSFVLWQSGVSGSSSPALVIGTFLAGNPPVIANRRVLALLPNLLERDLWELSIEAAGLEDGVYHYWFEVETNLPGESGPLHVPDPFAKVLDHRVLSTPGNLPASVVKISQGSAVQCDPEGNELTLLAPVLARLPDNHESGVHAVSSSWICETLEQEAAAVGH